MKIKITIHIIILIISVCCLSVHAKEKSYPADYQNLNTQQKSLVAISSYTAQGKIPELNAALNDGLNAGLSVNEINEALVQLYAYCGFPRIDAFLKEHLFADVFESNVLTYLQRELITNAALASMTGVESQLGAHLFFGMNVGITEGQYNDMFDIIEKTVGETVANEGRTILKGLLKRVNTNK